MQYFVILTKECNLLCKYCGGGSDTPPKEIQYQVEDLKSFLASDSDPVIEFYGGEPLLRKEAMRRIMDAVDAKFLIQTNGLLLDRLEPDLVSRFHSILLSIDGKKEVTDRERGAGVYQMVTRNAAWARKNGFRGDFIARMTVAQGTDIFDNVRHLLGTGLFDHVHWQLSFSMFWEAGAETEPGLEEWIAEYDSGVSSLAAWWVAEMRRTGRVPGIVPFIGVMNSLLTGREAGLRCGSGADFFAIMPDGKVSACPVSIDFDFSVVGSIFSRTPGALGGSMSVGEPCLSCDVFTVCGGRCLFVNKSQGMLREGGYRSICRTVRHLVAEMREALPSIQTLVREGAVSLGDFDYPEFNNGCEIIP